MIYYKIIDKDGRAKFYESNSPLFVKKQVIYNMLVRCSQEEAQGIISPEDNDTVCILEGKDLDGFSTQTSPIAYIISKGEYEEFIYNQERVDPEDESPQVQDDTPEETILTRAELTKRVEELEAQNRFLQDCLLEMSEIVYQ